MVRNELSPQSNFSNHCIFTKTRPGAGFSQCELNPDSLPARKICTFSNFGSCPAADYGSAAKWRRSPIIQFFANGVRAGITGSRD